jgi:D-arabinose 1-dehydrogenase-like Zn-dependent alcohol dehydrogenase
MGNKCFSLFNCINTDNSVLVHCTQASYVGTLEEFQELLKFVQNVMNLSIPLATYSLDQAAEALNDLVAGNIVSRLVLNPETSKKLNYIIFV